MGTAASAQGVIANLKADNWFNAAEAIMTTDTQPKAASLTTTINGHTVTMTGISKGAGAGLAAAVGDPWVRCFATDGVFVFVGYVPRTDLVKGLVKMNDWGYVETGEDMSTNVPGLYVAGDIRSKAFRQITTAVADGTGGHAFADNYEQHQRNVARLRQLEQQNAQSRASGQPASAFAPTTPSSAGAPTSRSETTWPASIRISVPDNAPRARVRSRNRDTDAIDGSASPRNPSVAILVRSPSGIFDVAWRSTASARSSRGASAATPPSASSAMTRAKSTFASRIA